MSHNADTGALICPPHGWVWEKADEYRCWKCTAIEHRPLRLARRQLTDREWESVPPDDDDEAGA